MTDWLDVSDTTPRVSYVATASQTAFTVPFVFFDEDDLKVYVNDTLKTLSTDYVTSGAEDEDGGTVTFNSGLSASDSVVIEREIALELTTHQPTSGPLDIAGLNVQLSRIVAMIQQVDADRPRSLRQPASDTDDLDDLPTASDRASKFLGFDADGQPVASSAVTGVTVSSFMQTVLDDTSASAARTTLGITDQTSYTALSNWHHCR